MGYEIFTFKAKFVIIFEVFTTHYIERLKENIKFFSIWRGQELGTFTPRQWFSGYPGYFHQYSVGFKVIEK